jgi:hypothetical protein
MPPLGAPIITRLPGHKDSVNALAVDAHGLTLSCSDDRSVRVWALSPARGALSTRLLQGAPEAVGAVAADATAGDVAWEDEAPPAATAKATTAPATQAKTTTKAPAAASKAASEAKPPPAAKAASAPPKAAKAASPPPQEDEALAGEDDDIEFVDE